MANSAALWTVAHQAPPSMGILQARILEWATMPSSRGSSRPRGGRCISYISCIGRWDLYHKHHLGSQIFSWTHFQSSPTWFCPHVCSLLEQKAECGRSVLPKVRGDRGLSRLLSGKESTCQAGDLSSIFESGRFPGEGNGNPLQYSFLGNPMEEEPWWATVHGVEKSQIQFSDKTRGDRIPTVSPSSLSPPTPCTCSPDEDSYAPWWPLSMHFPKSAAEPCKALSWWAHRI